MHKARLEAFSDGVIAIIITIMVLELHPPHSTEAGALLPMFPVFLSYALSFVYVGIYWNNHHHMLQAAQKVNGPILWANLHLLFWLSLIPFATAWAGESRFETAPEILYGSVLLFSGLAYYILAQTLVAFHGAESTLARAIGADFKGKISLVIYIAGVALAFFAPRFAHLIYASVAVLWLVPDRRIEKALRD
jgi:uncharacterized membrane protein